MLHCPGHTPGHVVFVNQAARFALVGDVLFQGSVGRTDFPYGDHAALIRAITEKLLPLGDDFRSCAGTARDRRSARSGGAIRSCGSRTGVASLCPSYAFARYSWLHWRGMGRA